MNGIEYQESMIMILSHASTGCRKTRRRSMPSHSSAGNNRPGWLLRSVVPIMKLTATGLIMNGRRKTTRKNLRPSNLLIQEKRQSEGDHVLSQDSRRRST